MPQIARTNSPDWNFIIETIKEEKCILLLGPEMAKTEDGIPLEHALLHYLDVGNNENILKYYNQDEVFLFKDNASKAITYYKIKECYNQINIDMGIYDYISRIPFHLIISTSPDLFLKKAFEKNCIKHRFYAYDKTKNPENLSPPRKSDPVIYNLFGCTDDMGSLVLTHDDLFDFLLAVIGNRNLPIDLRNTFQNAKNIIFLGFEFEKWYVQLLLRLLNMHNKYYEQAKYAAKDARGINVDIEDLCKAQFRIEFIDDDTEHFIQTLYDKCEKASLIRKESVQTRSLELSPIEKALDYIANDQVTEALTTLKEIIRPLGQSEMNDTLTSLSARYNRLMRRVQNGNINERDADRDSNQLILDLSSFSNTIRMQGLQTA
jgi:hypothetical protein